MNIAGFVPPSRQTQRYEHLLTIVKLKKDSMMDKSHIDSQGEIRDLIRRDALRARELDGVGQSESGEVDLTQSAHELATALPNVTAPPTPSASSMYGPKCTQGHLVHPGRHQEEKPSTARCS